MIESIALSYFRHEKLFALVNEAQRNIRPTYKGWQKSDPILSNPIWSIHSDLSNPINPIWSIQSDQSNPINPIRSNKKFALVNEAQRNIRPAYKGWLKSDPILSNPIRYDTIQYGYIIESTISYYPIRNGWKLWYEINGLFYYKSTQDWRSHDLQNIGLKIHNFSLELKQSNKRGGLYKYNVNHGVKSWQSCSFFTKSLYRSSAFRETFLW